MSKSSEFPGVSIRPGIRGKHRSSDHNSGIPDRYPGAKVAPSLSDQITLECYKNFPEIIAIIEWANGAFATMSDVNIRKLKLSSNEVDEIQRIMLACRLPRERVVFRHHGEVDFSSYDGLIKFLAKLHDLYLTDSGKKEIPQDMLFVPKIEAVFIKQLVN